jgi:hypothetical protein
MLCWHLQETHRKSGVKLQQILIMNKYKTMAITTLGNVSVCLAEPLPKEAPKRGRNTISQLDKPRGIQRYNLVGSTTHNINDGDTGKARTLLVKRPQRDAQVQVKYKHC